MLNKFKILGLLSLFLNSYAQQVPEVWLNVFVHGIVKTPFSINDFTRIAHNNVEGSMHYHMVNYLRGRSELYLHQPMQQKGLVRINSKDNNGCNGAVAMAKLYDYQMNSLTSHRLNQRQDNKPKAFNLYYTFGWSGYLSRLHRERDAKKLLNVLTEEVNGLKKKNINPKIRLISFSHGSNLVLNLAKHVPFDKESLPFIIDETVFLAIPVHKESDECINHPIFKKIYSFYSMDDMAPKADFFSTQYLFSHRKFGRKDFCVPNKLTQVQIRVTNLHFNKYGRVERQYHIDPNHMEFWVFGWKDKKYREAFPLKPFSIISLVPFLLNSIQSLPEPSQDLVLDIVPRLNKMVISDIKYDIYTPKKEYTVPFLSKYDFKEMKKICLQFKSVSELYEYNKDILIKNAMSYALCKMGYGMCGYC